VETTVVSNAHSANASPLANDVGAFILQNLQLPGTTKTLLTVLEDPALTAATGTITIGGSPVTGDVLQVGFTNNQGQVFTVTYTLTALDNGNISQTASDLANVINASPAVTGPNAVLASCVASGAAVTLVVP
jgi:hypothetical protein